MSRSVDAKALMEIDKDTFEAMFNIKTFCETQRNCHNCTIKKECKEICDKTMGNDVSSIDICRVEDMEAEDGYKYYLLCS